MKTKMKIGTCAKWTLMVLSLLLFAGCAGKQADELRVFWPALPAEPHMEWLGTYASQNDFKKTAAEKNLEYIVGVPTPYRFEKPTGIAGDSERGLVFIADGDANNIRVYDFNNRTVEFLSKNPLGQFPSGLALDSQGNLYMCDAMSGHVLVLSRSGAVKHQFGSGLIKKAAHLAINERLGRIYVSDSMEHKIVVFDMAGEHLFSFGEKGQGPTDLYVPQGLAIDGQDRVYVADQLNARLQVFDANGKHLRQIGTRGDQAWNFEAPRGLAFDSDGNLWAVDARKSSVALYNTEGQLLMYFNAGKKISHPLSLGFPNSIWIDGNDRVYISDLGHRRFQVWQFFSKNYKAKYPLTETEKQEQLRMLNERREEEMKE